MTKNEFPIVTVCENVFFAVEEENQVREGKIIAQHITRKDNPDTNECEWCNDLTIKCNDGKTYQTNANRCYTTLPNYRNDFPTPTVKCSFLELGINPDGRYYTIELGQVIEHKADIKTIDVVRGVQAWSRIFSSPDIPTDVRIFTKKEVAEQMCSTTWTDENGCKHVHDGLLSLVALNEEQKAAIKVLEDAFKHCVDIGIALGYDTDKCCIYAWNTLNVKYAGIEYDDYTDDEVAHWDSPDVHKDFLTSMAPTYIGPDDVLCVRRKDDSQEN